MVKLSYRQITEEQLAGIGRFIVEFSALEAAIKLGISMLTPLPEGIYHEILAGYDFAMACTVLDAVGKKRLPPEVAVEFSACIKKARAINDARVRVVHGTWQLYGEFRLEHVSRQKLQVSEHFAQVSELEALTREANDLHFRIFDICFENTDATQAQHDGQ